MKASILFLSNGNTARSIMAESILNHTAKDRFCGFSAGSFPSGKVNPLVLDFLEQQRIPTDGARSKNWDEFAEPNNETELDFVITVCDNAAGEVCPVCRDSRSRLTGVSRTRRSLWKTPRKRAK